eukprot:1138633-Rhodomonas_salina.1
MAGAGSAAEQVFVLDGPTTKSSSLFPSDVTICVSFGVGGLCPVTNARARTLSVPPHSPIPSSRTSVVSAAPPSALRLSTMVSPLRSYVRAPLFPSLSSDEASAPRLSSPSLCSSSR